MEIDIQSIFDYLSVLIAIAWASLLLATTISYWWKGTLFIYALIHGRKGNSYSEAQQNHRYCILIPARNESSVIEALLESLAKQNYPKENLMIVIGVENLKDPTCEIAKKYGCEIYVRRYYDKSGKGPVIKEMTEYVCNELKWEFEAYFIFDADNVVDPNYFYEMNKAVDAGFPVGVGYRNAKNWNSNWVASCSALTFTRFSTLENLGRTRFKSTVQLSGTGFYITRKQLEKLGGWNFFTLTEDLELTLRLAVDNVPTAYVSKAIFYDEQPTKWTDSVNQRMRWVKGFAQANQIYKKGLRRGMINGKSNRLGCYDFYFQAMPFGFFLGTLIFTTLAYIVQILSALGYRQYLQALMGFLTIIGLAVIAYLGVVLDTWVTLLIEGDRIKMGKKQRLVTMFMNPIYLFAYIPIALKSMRKKTVDWVPIKHEINRNYDDVVNGKDNNQDYKK